MSALATAYLARLPRFDCRCVSVCEGERETPVIAWIVWALNCTPYCRLVCAHVARLKTAAIMNVRRSWKTGWRIARTHSIVWSETAFEWNAREWRAERLSGQIQVKFKPLATGTQCAESGFHVNNVKTERNTQSKKKKKTAAKATLNNINFLCLIVQCCARVRDKKRLHVMNSIGRIALPSSFTAIYACRESVPQSIIAQNCVSFSDHCATFKC